MGTEKRERQKELRRARLEAAAEAHRRQARTRRIVMTLVAVVVIGGLIGLYVLLSDGDDSEPVAVEATTSTAPPSTPPTTADPALPPPPGPGETISGETPCPALDGSSPRTTSFESAPPMCLEEDRTYTATFTTNLGDIVVELDTENTPQTTNNFAVLANYHYYDGTAIFRTDPSIEIIQGGAPTTNSPSDPGPGYTIEDEGSGYTYGEGQLVMARTPAPNSAGAQFFFVAGPKASSLDADGSYVVFGEVVEGFDLVQQILASHEEDPASQLGGHPAEPVIVEKVTITESPA